MAKKKPANKRQGASPRSSSKRNGAASSQRQGASPGSKKPAKKKPAKKAAKKKAPSSKRQAASPRSSPSTRSDAYVRHRDRMRKRAADQSRAGREIGPLPKCTDPALRDRLGKSLKAFCETALSEWFTLEWSPDHLEALAKIENCIRNGDVFALAMPRGSGKTTIILAAILWAILYGYRRYIALIASDKDAAVELLVGLKTTLETNETLLELFPEAIAPIREIDGDPRRAHGQLLENRRTHMQWKSKKVVFASLDGCPSSGAVIETFGILSRIRGAKHITPDGENIRPDCFMLDDPQTDTSADSLPQIRRRLNVAQGTVLGLAGPGRSISGFACMTVIQEDDMADQLLNRDKFPDWSGQRHKLVYQWPTDGASLDHWDKYGLIRAECLKAERPLDEANEYVSKHFEIMHKGSKVGWEDRFDRDKGEVSALQHAYNLRFKTPDTFDSEYQNSPRRPESEIDRLTVAELEAKQNGFRRGELPPWADTLTAFVDVQGKCLYYVVCAWDSAKFSGSVLEFGAWPEQTAVHFTLRNLSKTLARKYPRRGLEGRIRAGLFDLVDTLSARRYVTRDGSQSMRIQLIGIDSGWGQTSDTVKAVCLEHPRAAWLLPTIGKGIKPTDIPMSDWRSKPGERKGPFWVMRPTQGGGRHCLVDTNAAKSFTNSRLNVALGDPGCIAFYRPKLLTELRMMAEHITSETVNVVSVTGGRTSEVWKLPPAQPDNHLWDCLVGSVVGASICGASLPDSSLPRPKPKRHGRRKLTLKV